MGDRPKIKKEVLMPVTNDELEFTKNKCSENARKISVNDLKLEFEVWFDKHYFHREREGDDDGKREGIDFDVVKELIKSVAKHLIYYSLKVKNFSFVNFGVLNRPERIVIAKAFDENLDLNIVVEYHFLSLNRYEVTLITALRKNNFYINDGQYQIKIDMDETSILYRKERGQTKLVSDYSE